MDELICDDQQHPDVGAQGLRAPHPGAAGGRRVTSAAQFLIRSVLKAERVGNHAVGLAHLFDYLDAHRDGRMADGYSVVLSAMVATRDERQAVEEPLGLRSEAILISGLGEAQ